MAGGVTYPTGGEYREALSNTQYCFRDPVLMGGQPTLDPLGMPKAISGNFASVFTICDSHGRRWAVKCFTRSVHDQAVRYQRISETLAGIHSPWLVGFEYLPEGVLCQGRWYPVLKMEWVEATGLMSFIEAHLWHPPMLANLAVKFAQMVADLERHGIAHGDLQHGNLLVTPSGDLRLIDYDGMFVPTLQAAGASERGHANYQSPARTMETWGPWLDRFSAWIIYTSLVALTIDPTLWSLLHRDGDEALLFHKDDFVRQRSSRALMAMTQSANRTLQTLGESISRLCVADLAQLPALDFQTAPAPNCSPSPLAPAPTASSPLGASRLGGPPDWIVDAQSARGAPGPVGGSSWVTGHLPPLPSVAFGPSVRPLKTLLVLALAIAVAAGTLGGFSVIPPGLAGAVAILLVAAALASSRVLFRRTPEAREKATRKVAVHDRHAAATKASHVARVREKERRDVDARERVAIDKLTKRANGARAAEQKELAGIDNRLATQLSDIAKRRQSLQSSESIELGNALRAVQEQHVLSGLKLALVRSASLPGIGPGTAQTLAAYGIHSAADFSGISYVRPARGGNPEVWINLRGGTRVHPRGVGAKKAQTLEAWRRSVEARCRANQPSSLPLPQAEAIRLKYQQQRQASVNQEQNAQALAANEQSQVRQKWAATHASISGEVVSTRQTFAQQRAQADLALTDAERHAADAAWAHSQAERALRAYRDVTHRRYLASVIRR